MGRPFGPRRIGLNVRSAGNYFLKADIRGGGRGAFPVVRCGLNTAHTLQSGPTSPMVTLVPETTGNPSPHDHRFELRHTSFNAVTFQIIV